MVQRKAVRSFAQGAEPYHLDWSQGEAADALIFVRRDFLPPDTLFPAHDHDFAELIILERGRLEHRGGAFAREMRRGDIALVPPRCRHQLQSPPDAAAIFLNVPMHPTIVAALHLLTADPFLAGLAEAEQPLDAGLTAIDLAVMTGLAAQAMERGGRRLACSLVLFLLQRLAEPTPATALPSALRRALDGLDTDAALAEGLPYLARRSGLHPDSVSRHLRQVFHCNASQLLLQRRIDRIAELAMDSDLPIAACCRRVGISNRTHLNARFKERYGCTPGALRANRGCS